MISSVLFLLVTANLFVYSVEAKARMKKYMLLQDLKPCSIVPGEPQMNGSFRYTGQGSFFLNIDLYTPRQIDHLYLFADIKKCPTKVRTDDCEDMLSFPAGDQCNEGDAYFRSIYSSFKPPIACPILGYYQAKDVVLEPEKYEAFFRGVGEEEWLHVYVEIYSDEKKRKKEICIIAIVTMRKMPIRGKTSQKRKQ